MKKNNLRKLTVYERVTLLNAITRSRHSFEDALNNQTTFLADWEISDEIQKLNNIEKLLLKMYVEEDE